MLLDGDRSYTQNKKTGQETRIENKKTGQETRIGHESGDGMRRKRITEELTKLGDERIARENERWLEYLTEEEDREKRRREESEGAAAAAAGSSQAASPRRSGRRPRNCEKQRRGAQ